MIAAKLRNLPESLKESILNQDNYRSAVLANEFGWIGEFAYNGKKLITSYKKRRALKDSKGHQRVLDKIQKRLSGSSDTKKLITNQGVKKYTKTTDSKTTVDDGKVMLDAMWDGLHGVMTNIDDENQTLESIMARYPSLWKIEASFRIDQYRLKMRPCIFPTTIYDGVGEI